MDAAAATEERRTADRKQLFRAQIDSIKPYPIAGAVTNREIDILGYEFILQKLEEYDE